MAAPAAVTGCMFRPLEARVEEEIDNGSVSDVCFGSGPGEGARLFSSRAALALASPVFNTMFFTPHWRQQGDAAGAAPAPPGLDEVREPASSSEPGEAKPPGSEGGYNPARHFYVAVTDVEPSALRCMLRYIHHLDPHLTLDNALHVYRAADKYQIDGLLGACATFLDQRADPQNVDQMLRLFDIACRLGIERYSALFLEKLGELSRLQTSKFLSAEEYYALHSASVATLLGSDGLCVDEEPLWLALRRWAQLRAAASNRPELSPEAAEGSTEQPAALVRWQDLLRPLKRHIRFPTMNTSFFAREVAHTDVLSPQEAVGIFCHLARRSAAAGVAASDGETMMEDVAEPPEVPVVDAFRTEPRAPRLAWCASAGVPDVVLPEECGLSAGAALGSSAGVAVLDGRGLSTLPWGPSIVLGGSGAGFHFAFGSRGFSSGRHAWTISWRPLETAAQSAGARSRASRGGAAGIAREGEVFRDRAGAPASAGGGGPPSAPTPRDTSSASMAKVSGSSVLSGRFAGSASLSGAASAGASPGLGSGSSNDKGADEPATRFVDWPTCFVFGVKKDVSERRYVAWEAPEDATDQTCVRFAIVLDFVSRIVRYIADGGERSWSAPLVHNGPVYPVIAASGPHLFRIQYGVHL